MSGALQTAAARRQINAMPRYYFSFENGHSITADDGKDLANDEAARSMAQRIARDMAKNKTSLGLLRVIARTGAGRIVCEVLLKDNT